MTGRTHDMAAFTALTIVVVTHPLPHITVATAVVALVSNMIGGIAPDIDQPTAPLWRNLPVAHFFGKIFGKIMGGHRSVSHSILGFFIFGVGWHYLLLILSPSFPLLNQNIIWYAFMIGFGSHLVMDTFTHEGVPWLFPLAVKFGFPPIRALRVQTGGLIERFAIFPGLILINVGIIYWHYGLFKLLLHSYLK